MKNKLIRLGLLIVPLLPLLILIPSFMDNQLASNHQINDWATTSVSVDGILSLEEKEQAIRIYEDEVFVLQALFGELNNNEYSGYFETDKGLWLGLERKDAQSASINDLVYFFFDLENKGLEPGKELVIRVALNSSLDGIGFFYDFWQISSDFTINEHLPFLSEHSLISDNSLFIEVFISGAAFSNDQTMLQPQLLSVSFCLYLEDHDFLFLPKNIDIYDVSTFFPLTLS
ncbi:MAG: hypothetical protein ACFFCQ_14420 [Promethearchaeota archaeon]